MNAAAAASAASRRLGGMSEEHMLPETSIVRMIVVWLVGTARMTTGRAIAMIVAPSAAMKRTTGKWRRSRAEPGSARLRRHLPVVLFMAALGATIIAMARPVVILAVPTNQTTIILTIDVSGSMCSSDIPPSRLEAAEAAAAAFIKSQSS